MALQRNVPVVGAPSTIVHQRAGVAPVPRCEDSRPRMDHYFTSNETVALGAIDHHVDIDHPSGIF